MGYYDAERFVCLARRKPPDGNWKILRFIDYVFKSNDAHNTISIGICPKDGTIHLAFDHHGHELHYRVSRKGAVLNPEARRYHHYWREKSGSWQHRELPWIAGNRPKLFIDKNDNAYLIYSAQHKSSMMDHGIYFSKGDLIIAAATFESQWTDWNVIHTEKGPFVNEMLGDLYRWKKEGILSILVQGSPEKAHEATPLRILDFSLTTD